MSSKSHFFRRGLPFIATFRTTTDNETITLPYLTTGTYSGTIDWGDGTVVENSYDNSVHSYSVSGDYDITVKGNLVGWNFNNSGDKLKIIDIKRWGSDFRLINSSNYFRGCTNLDITATDVLNLDVTSARYIFRECSSLIGNEFINNWDVSNLLDFYQFFYQCTLFNQPLNNWNTSNATNFAYMFQNAINFNQPLNNWITSNIFTMQFMFRNAQAFNQDISSWDFSGLTTTGSMSNFMQQKSASNYDATYYDNLLIKWALDESLGGLPNNLTLTKIDMGSIKYTSNGASARQSILDNNKAQIINDGGQI